MGLCTARWWWITGGGGGAVSKTGNHAKQQQTLDSSMWAVVDSPGSAQSHVLQQVWCLDVAAVWAPWKRPGPLLDLLL